MCAAVDLNVKDLFEGGEPESIETDRDLATDRGLATDAGLATERGLVPDRELTSVDIVKTQRVCEESSMRVPQR